MWSRNNESKQIVSKMKGLGYKPLEKGVCYGLSIMAIQALLAGDFATFDARLKLIMSSDPSLLKSNISKAKSKRLAGGDKALSETERLLLTIDTLFTCLDIHSQPDHYEELFEKGKGTVTQNHLKTLPLTLPALLKQIDEVAAIALQADVNKMSNFLTTLKQAVPDQPIGILFANKDHTIAAGYDSVSRKWIIVDSENLPVKTVDNEWQAASEILTAYRAFLLPAAYTFIANIFVSTLGPDQQRCLEAWRASWQQTAQQRFGQYSTEERAYLLHAAAEGDPDTIQALLTTGIDVNCMLGGTTALYVAASKGRTDIVQILLENGADPDKGYDDGLSPLIIAAENGATEVVKLLLAHEADPSGKCDDGAFPLLVAVERGNFEVIELLLPALSDYLLEEEEATELREVLQQIRDQAVKERIIAYLDAHAPRKDVLYPHPMPFFPPVQDGDKSKKRKYSESEVCAVAEEEPEKKRLKSEPKTNTDIQGNSGVQLNPVNNASIKPGFWQ